MGRTSQTLSHGRAQRAATGPASPISEAGLDTEPVALSPPNRGDEETPLGDNDNVPFIEVGGPRRAKPEAVAIASPILALAAPAPVAPNLRLAPDTDPIRLIAFPSATPEEPPVAIAFLPLPGQGVQGQCDPRKIAPEVVAFHRPDHPMSQQYRALCAGITGQLLTARSPVVVFTHTEQDFDAATVVLNIAVIKAREDKCRVLVIDADLERPLVADRLGIAAMPGLRDLLNQSVPVNLALHRTAQENLTAIPPGDGGLAIPGDSRDRLAALIARLRQRFDWVLVNGPLWNRDHAEWWVRFADVNYLVVRPGEWDAAPVEAAHQGIEQAGGHLGGYITKSDKVGMAG